MPGARLQRAIAKSAPPKRKGDLDERILSNSVRAPPARCRRSDALAGDLGRARRPVRRQRRASPLAVDFQQLAAGLTPPTEAQCNAVGRRCFAPAAVQNAYNLPALYNAGNQGQGITVAVVDSFGSNTVRADLNNFDTQFGLPHMCGEDNHTCAASDPIFDILCVQACSDTKSPPPTSQSPAPQDRSAWIVEVSLDVEWVHAVAPRANVLLVTTPVAETLGVQGFTQMMNAEQSLIDSGQAQVISQSFGASELTSTAASPRSRTCATPSSPLRPTTSASSPRRVTSATPTSPRRPSVASTRIR
jgi:hypothetical protein